MSIIKRINHLRQGDYKAARFILIFLLVVLVGGIVWIAIQAGVKPSEGDGVEPTEMTIPAVEP